ncbi:metalloprotease [Bacteroidia bacterium]|nr:metalloprotease [Bacteroidia bacterium]
MKKTLPLVALFSLAAICGCNNIGNVVRLVSAAAKTAQVFTLSDEQVESYTRQFLEQMDSDNILAPDDSPQVRRINRITKTITGREGIDIKIYITDQVNAFACADGSLRICSGLMEIMSDAEIVGVVGHEIGHVKCRHIFESFKNALMTSAARDAVGSAGGTVAVLSNSALGDVGEAFLGARYSQKYEYEADDYGYDLLRSHNVNPRAMIMALEKLKSLEDSAGVDGSTMGQLFSTHPELEARIKKLQRRATVDAVPRPKSKQGAS